MKKVYIYAYSKTNLGDDIFVKTLCERYPDTKFYIQSPMKHSKAYKHIGNLKVIMRVPYIDAILKMIGSKQCVNRMIESFYKKKASCVVRIGGSIFMEPTNGITNYDDLKAKYLGHDLPVFVIGANFGPYYSEEFFDFYKLIFLKLRDLCFRDHYSYSLFNHYPNVRVAPDVLFGYPLQASTSQTYKSVLFSVIDLTNRPGLRQYNEIYQKKMAELCSVFLKREYTVKLMSFCASEGDAIAINKIISRITDIGQSSIVQTYNYNGNVDEAIAVIEKSDYMIATRFHAMILGFIMNKIVFPVIYSQKTENVLCDIGFTGQRTTITEIDNVKAEQVLEYFTSCSPLDAVKHKFEAEQQFQMLDEFLL